MSARKHPRLQPPSSPATSLQTMGLAAVLIALGAVVAARFRTRQAVRQPGAS